MKKGFLRITLVLLTLAFVTPTIRTARAANVTPSADQTAGTTAAPPGKSEVSPTAGTSVASASPSLSPGAGAPPEPAPPEPAPPTDAIEAPKGAVEGESLPPEITADSAVLMDARTGLIIYAKNKEKKEFPASVTKVMTALLALEKGENNPDERVYFSHEAVYSIERGSSHIAMNEDETLSLRDALYGLLLPSANEVANALAEYVGGTTANFADMMTARAKELGAVNTHFVNSNGLDNPDHYTCAYDMALIMQEAVKHPLFIQVIGTKSYKIPPTERQPEERPLNNTNKMIMPGRFYYEDIVGGKTGYTDIALHTLVNYAERDGAELICVVLNEPKNMDYMDTAALLDYGFGMYKPATLFDKADYSGTADVLQPLMNTDEGIKTTTLEFYAENSVEGVYPSFALRADLVEVVEELTPNLRAPVEKDEIIGKLSIRYDGREIGSAALRAKEAVELEAPAGSDKKDKNVRAEAASVFSEGTPEKEGGVSFLKVILILFLTLAAAAAAFLGTIVGIGKYRRWKRKYKRYRLKKTG